ncbi:MAG: DUF4340 domain-containing protein [Oscillospiraceae bacterium]|nr:DUF4340 domain-containing protein [Oscillospiraceae bacterium]
MFDSDNGTERVNRKKKKGKMWKTLVILLAGALVLGAGAYFITSGKDNGVSESSGKETIVLFSSSALKEVSVENGKGGYTLTVDESGTGTVPELSGIPTNLKNIKSVVQKSGKISAAQLVKEDLSDSEEYGLSQPSAKIEIKYGDGESFKISLGDSVPGNVGVYAECGGKIYIIQNTAANVYFYGYNDLADLALTPEVDPENEVVIFGDIELGGWSRKEKIMISRTEEDEDTPLLVAAGFEMTEPKRRLVSFEAADEIFNSVLNIHATGIEIMHATQEDISEKGLADPYTYVKYVLYEDTDMTKPQYFGIYVSEPDEDGNCFAMIDGSEAIYVIKYVPDSIFDAEYKDLLDNMPILPYINNVAEFIIKIDGTTYDYVLTLDSDENLTVVCNGTTIDTDNFRSLYQSVLMLSGEEFVEDEPEVTEPYMTVIYKYVNTNYDDNEINFYKGPLRRYYAEFNGGIDFTVKEQKIDDVKDKCEKLQRGENIEVIYY